MPFRVVRDREITIPAYQDEPFRLGDTIPDEAFQPEYCPNRKLKRSLIGLKWVKEMEPGATQPSNGNAGKEVADRWPEHHGGPWFLTPDGKKHRGKKAALAHMETL